MYLLYVQFKTAADSGISHCARYYEGSWRTRQIECSFVSALAGSRWPRHSRVLTTFTRTDFRTPHQIVGLNSDKHCLAEVLLQTNTPFTPTKHV